MSELRRRRQMPAAVTFRSPENRYFLRLYVLLREPESRAAYRWLWDNRAVLWERRRRPQARRRSPKFNQKDTRLPGLVAHGSGLTDAVWSTITRGAIRAR